MVAEAADTSPARIDIDAIPDLRPSQPGHLALAKGNGINVVTSEGSTLDASGFAKYAIDLSK